MERNLMNPVKGRIRVTTNCLVLLRAKLSNSAGRKIVQTHKSAIPPEFELSTTEPKPLDSFILDSNLNQVLIINKQDHDLDTCIG
jgi:hypothetical protein